MEAVAQAAVIGVDPAVREAEKNGPMPPPETMFEDVYEHVPEILKDQQAAMMKDFKEHGLPGAH